MAYDVADLVHAAEARLQHGERAGQYFVDLMLHALRTGDEESASRADRALRVVNLASDWRARYSLGGVGL